MEKKYSLVGLDLPLIISKYPDINEYEEIVNAYLDDPFFQEIEGMIDDEDYELLKDALKGLYMLAQDLYLYPLYIALVDIYEDLEEDDYSLVHSHYNEMNRIYSDLRSTFSC